MKLLVAVAALGLVAELGCSPKIYLVDRQTVLEDEAAGEWPEFEKEILAKAKAQGPTPFPQSQDSERKDRLYQVLNGELTTPSERK